MLSGFLFQSAICFGAGVYIVHYLRSHLGFESKLRLLNFLSLARLTRHPFRRFRPLSARCDGTLDPVQVFGALVRARR